MKHLIIIFLISFTTSLEAQPQWITYNTSNSNLPNNLIQSIAVDGDNNIWVGTPRAIAKFNGLNWMVFDSTNSPIPNNPNGVLTVKIDYLSNIWIATSANGLIKYDGENFTQLNAGNSPLPSNNIHSLNFENDSTMWIGSGGCVVKKVNSDWTVYCDSNSGYIGGAAIDIEFQNDIKWIVPYFFGFEKFDNVTWTNYNPQNSPLPYREVRDIELDIYGNKWIGLRFGWLVKFNDPSWVIYDHTNSGIPSNTTIFKVLVDKKQVKWLATGRGLVKYNDTTWSVFNDTNSQIPINDLTTLEVDSNSNLIIGTFGGGLAIFNENGIVSIKNIANEIPSNSILYQNFPNPFNPFTKIRFEITRSSNVKFTIYNINGQEISTPIQGKLSPGTYEYTFSAENLPSGFYFYQINVDNLIQTKKMILLK